VIRTADRRISTLLFLLLAPLLYAFEFWFIRQPHPPSVHDLCTLAVTIDLTVVLPLLFYALVARPRRLSGAILLSAFLVACGIAAAILPHGEQRYLLLLRTLVAPLEFVLLGYGALAARDVRQQYHAASRETDDVLERLRLALEATPRLTPALRLLLLEGVVLYYGLIAWRVRRASQPGDFYYHRESGLSGLLAGGLLLAVVEGAAVHVIAGQWSAQLAWVLTALDLYSVLWGIAFYQAARLRPIVIQDGVLHLRVSLLWTLVVPCREIETIRRLANLGNRDIRRRPELLRATVVRDPQFAITLRSAHTAHGLFGLRRSVRYLLVAVDESDRFEQALRPAGEAGVARD